MPFRETVAYRTLLAGASFLAFVIALYILIGAISTNTTLAFAAGAVGAAAAYGILFNLERMRSARVPKRTLDRMKRR